MEWLAFAFMSAFGAVLLYFTVLAILEFATRREVRRNLLVTFRERPVGSFFVVAMYVGALGFLVFTPLAYLGFEPSFIGWRLWAASVTLMIVGATGALFLH